MKLKEPTKWLQVRLELAQWQALANLAISRNVSISTVVRDELTSLLSGQKKRLPPLSGQGDETGRT